MVRMWGSGKIQHLANPDMPWNEEIRATWARHERLAVSPRTLALVMPLVTEVDVRAVLPTNPPRMAISPGGGAAPVDPRADDGSRRPPCVKPDIEDAV